MLNPNSGCNIDGSVERLMDLLNSFKNTDMCNTPIAITKKAIRRELISRGWNADKASVLVTKMNINFSQEAVDHPRFNEVIKTYVDVIVRIHTACINDYGTRCIDEVFDAMIGDFSLELGV
jgi:hypothetical protein